MQNKKEAAARILKDAEVYSNLKLNGDFIHWKKEVVDARLESLRSLILNVDRKQPSWKENVCDLIGAYQELMFIVEHIFTIKQWQEDQARKTLKEVD